MDATIDGQTTRVLFALGEAPPAAAGAFLAALRPHLTTDQVARFLPDGPPAEGIPIRYLSIQDFNTRGLEGDPARQEPLNADGSKNHFFRFWHLVGQYGGEVKRRGSWGVGKVVFSNASRIRTFFGLTLRPGEQTPLLMGEASLIIHKPSISTDFCDWYGYYAAHERIGSYTVPMPIRNTDLITEFSHAFSLLRKEPGLSVVVPHVREKVTQNELARCVTENFLLAILAGRLAVTVSEGAQRDIVIDQATIEAALERITWSPRGHSTKAEVAALLRIARWQLGLSNSDYVSLKPVTAPYSITADHFPEAMLRRLSDDFAFGKRIAIRVPVCVRPRGGALHTELVRVVLERDESLRTGNVPHLRSGISISKLREAGAGVRGFLIVGNESEPQGELDKLLQASEGPAHLNWETRGEGYDKAKSQYDDAGKAIALMRHTVANLVDRLAAPQDTRDMRTLAPFFPDYDQIGTGRGASAGAGRGTWNRSKAEPTEAPVPPGTITGVVRELSFSDQMLRPVVAADITVFADNPEPATLVIASDQEGRFRADALIPGHYRIIAHKENIGRAQKEISLTAECGIHVELLLRKPVPPKQYSRIKLDDGFRIEGNPHYGGAPKAIRVQLAYAAWGGSKSFNPADFSLHENTLVIRFAGIRETKRSAIVVGPNVLKFTPMSLDFYVEVRGFDTRRALHVDPRTVDMRALAKEGDE